MGKHCRIGIGFIVVRENIVEIGTGNARLQLLIGKERQGGDTLQEIEMRENKETEIVANATKFCETSSDHGVSLFQFQTRLTRGAGFVDSQSRDT